METIEILNKVKSGELTVEEAERFFKKQPFEKAVKVSYVHIQQCMEAQYTAIKNIH